MTVHAIVVRDVSRAVRQKSRLLGGLARPFMWLLLVGTGYSTIVHVEGARSYHAFVFPGIIVMAALFGAMLTGISTVYDREFGMLRLMLASPAGVPAVLAGRAIAAAVIGMLQGGVVLLCLPLVVSVTATQLAAATAALALGATASGVLGLLVAAPLRSVSIQSSASRSDTSKPNADVVRRERRIGNAQIPARTPEAATGSDRSARRA